MSIITHFSIAYQAHGITRRKFEAVSDYSGTFPKLDFRETLLAMPSNLYPAIVRAKWWQDKHKPYEPLRMDLSTKDGKPIGTLFATPIETKP